MLKPKIRVKRPPFSISRRTGASPWLASLGMLGALCTGGPAFAQGDASAALIEQGTYWQSMGRAELAEESWKKLLRVDPKSADAMYGMAQVELTRGNADAARGWTTQLRTAHPDDPRNARLQQQARQPGAPASDLQRARAAAKAGRAAEAVQLYRTLFNNKAPPSPLALEFYEVLGGTPQGYDEAREGMEQLVKDQPANTAAKLALAQLQTYRESTRRDGIKLLAALSRQPAVATRAKASWRQALIWLDARAPDVPLYQDYLAGQADAAVSARLETLTAPPTASTASPAAQPLGEGYKALDRGDTAGAERGFQQALKAQPGDAEALGGLGLIRLRQKRFAEAQDLLQQASKGKGGARWASALRSASYWTLIGQATAAREKNDSAGARSLLERAVRLDPREPVGQNDLADLRLAEGQFADAERGYRAVLDIKPADTQALRGLITVYTRQGRAADALALSQKLTPEQAAQVGSLRDVQVEQARSQARMQIEAGDPAAAQRTLEDAMLAAPDSPWVRLDLANIYRRNGMMAQARGVMDGLLMSQPDMPDALFASALLASDAGDPAAGLQYLDRIPANARTSEMTQLQRRLWAQGQTQRAQALAKQGQAGAARNVLAQTEATLGANMPSELWGQLASAYAEIGDAPRALAMSRQLLTRTPNPGIGDRLLYASILMKTQQDVELNAVLRQLMTLNMTTAQRGDFDSLRVAYTLRQTDALREAGNLEAAYEAMAPLVAERPNDPQVLAALARLYSAARDERQALALYQRILQRMPTDLDTLVAAAASASALREHGDAENYVAAALKQAPDQSSVLAAAGRVYRNAGDNARAEQYLRAAVQAGARAASGPALASAQGGGMAMPAGNPFAGMTGSNAAAAASPFAGMQRVAMPAAMAYPVAYPMSNQAVYPALYPGAPPGFPLQAQATMQPDMPWGGPSQTSAQRTAPVGTAPRTAAERRRAAAAIGKSSASPQVAQARPFQPIPPSYQQAVQPYPPVPQAYPPVAQQQGASAAGGLWRTDRRASAAPVDPVLAELQALEADRSPTLSAGTVFRTRAGESGLSKLSDMQIPIEARFPVGNGKIVVGATPTFLDAGALSPAYGTASRFGGGPSAAISQLQGTGSPVASQNASGVGLSVGYEGKNLNASIGTTPLGFPETNVIGNITYQGQLSENVSLKGDLSRRAVTDSLLSFAGAKDARTGERFGGVVATGGRLDLTRDDGTYGFYGYGSYHSVTGSNVESNDRAELGGGLYVHLMKSASSTLTAGMNLDLLHYDKNLSYYTFGQGGYFSPQRYMSVAFPVDWTGRDDRLSWRLNASLGVQSFTQSDSPYFPTDPSRQSAAAAAAATATALGQTSGAFTGNYAGSSKTGLAYNLAGLLEYQLAPQLYLGGLLSLNNASNFRQVTGGIYLRYMFGGSREFGRAGAGTTLRPLSSPYTPLL